MERISFIVIFLAVSMFARSDVAYKRLATYAAHIGYFNQLCPQEKVYLHLDNTAYFQGETIWYAANVVGQSKVLYVELLSPTGVVLKQQKLKVVDGRCHGSFTLIDSAVKEAVEKRGAIGYPSGYYQIRAYTRAMLNFDDACIFSRVIPVYKAPDEEGNYADPIMRQYNGMETNRPEVKKSEKPDKLNMAFYPEGGHLLSGVPCRIAFKATDQHGHGVPVEAIADRHGHALTLGLQHNGMGSFVYTTTKGKDKDKLTATYGGKKYTFTLPEVETVGCALQLDNNTSDGIQADITFIGALPDDLLAYTVTSSGKVVAFDTVRCSTGTRHLFINKEKMPTGVAQLTLYGASGAVYAQRLFFVDNGCPMVSVTVTADKEAYRPFDQVNLRLQAAATDSTTFSLAVRDAADYGTAYRDDIRTYMLLSSELKGLIEEPEWYFRPTPSLPHREVAQTREKEDGSSNASPQVLPMREDLGGSSDRVRALDLLMMVQGWTRYDWRMMAGVEPFAVRHYTEEQLVVDGWAFSRIKEEPLANTDVFIRLSSPDRQHRQETVIKTDSLGYWSLGVEDFEGEWDLYMETRQPGRNGERRTTRIRMERSSAPGVYAYDPIDTYLPSYSWDADALLTVKDAEDSEFKLPTDAHQLDEIVVDVKRKYIDYCTFKAFDAEKDAELMIDAGNYTYKVEDYLCDKGYDIVHYDGMSFEDYLTTAELMPETLPKVYRVIDDSQEPDDTLDISKTNIYYQWLVDQVKVDGYRTFWYVHEDEQYRTKPSYFNGFELDLSEVKSIIVYDDKMMFASFAPIVDNMPHRLIEHFLHVDSETGSPGGLCVVDIELNPSRKRRTYVENNARATSFKGYDTPVEFYAPTYPDGPVQGDKDYRRTVYWNPEVTTDANGVANVIFYNNGYSRSLTVSAEGLTADGVPILNQYTDRK